MENSKNKIICHLSSLSLCVLVSFLFWFLIFIAMELEKDFKIEEKTASIIGILTLNIFFSWQITQNLNRLDDIVHKFKEETVKEIEGCQGKKKASTDSVTLEKLLREQDVVYSAHHAFTLGVVLQFLVTIGTFIIYDLKIIEVPLTIRFNFPLAIGFACFSVGYLCLMRSSISMYKGHIDDWKLLE